MRPYTEFIVSGFDTNCVEDMVDKPTQRISNPVSQESSVGWGTATLKSDAQVKITIEGFPNPLLSTLTHRMIVGRIHEGSNSQVDIDLSSYFAVERGVSRVHAALEIVGRNLMVTDLNSSNGTYLNGQRLKPNQPRLVRDSDELRMGDLTMYIWFV